MSKLHSNYQVCVRKTSFPTTGNRIRLYPKPRPGSPEAANNERIRRQLGKKGEK